MLPIVKVYEIDYDFIIKNYLDPKLWNKIWTVFVYKEHVFTLQMTNINVTDNSITFKVSLNGVWNSRRFSYNIANSNINFLKKSLNGEIKRLIEDYEEQEIRRTEEFCTYYQYLEDEKDKLVGFAEDFLDANGVSNKEIREVYIDNYVSENSELDSELGYYILSKKYSLLPDFYLIFAKATNNSDLKKMVENNCDEDRLGWIKENIQEMYDAMETIEWEETMVEKLEAI